MNAALIKANLSTRTEFSRLRSTRDVEPEEKYTAQISEAASFATFLWEASVVSLGGFYLQYTTGGGLPDFIFDQDGKATIYLLCLPESQSVAGGALHPWHNCAVLGDGIDLSISQMYVKATSSNVLLPRVATVPPGIVGVTIERANSGSLSDRVFSMIGMSNYSGLVLGATIPPGGAALHVDTYQALFNAARVSRTARIYYVSDLLPPVSEDPYAGIGSRSGLTVYPFAVDVYGNAPKGSSMSATTLPSGYNDHLIGVSEWPGCGLSYTVPAVATGAVPQFLIALSMNASGYTAGFGTDVETAQQAALTAAARYRQIFYQSSRGEMLFNLTTSLNGPGQLHVNNTPLANFIYGAYLLTSQLSNTKAVLVTPLANETLASFASRTSSSAMRVLEENRDMVARSVFSGTCTVPVYERFATGETLNSFAARTGTTVSDLLTTGNNGDLIVPAGTRLNTMWNYNSQANHGQTLREAATELLTDAADIGVTNATNVNLIADGLTLSVRGISLITDGATFASLQAAWADAGVVTTPEEIATLHQDIIGFFADPVNVSFNISLLILPVDTALSDAVSQVDSRGFQGQGFVSFNSDLPGILPGNLPVQIGSSTYQPSGTDTLGRWIEHDLQLTLAAFAAQVTGDTLNMATDLRLPDVADISGVAYVPYTVPQPGSIDTVGADGTTETVVVPNTMATVAASFLSDATTLTSLNQNIPGLMASDTTSLVTGAFMMCPTPRVPHGGLWLGQLAVLFGVDVEELMRLNGATKGLLQASASVTRGSVTVTAGEYGTLSNMIARLQDAGEATTPEEEKEVLSYMSGQAFLQSGATFLMPGWNTTIPVTLTNTPQLTTAITPLTATLEILRPTGSAHPDFTNVPGILSVTSDIAPEASGSPASYLAFAQGVEAGWSGLFRVATGRATGGNQRLYLVRFDSIGTTDNAIRKVAFNTDRTVRYALAPLSNQPISRTVDVRPYASGATEPLAGAATPLLFQAVDIEAWAREALQAIDLMLSPANASAIYRLTAVDGVSSQLNQMVTAKATLAKSIPQQQLTAVFTNESPTGDAGEAARTAAAAVLEQSLRTSLSYGYATDAVLQVGTTIDASFEATGDSSSTDAGAHRFVGSVRPKPVVVATSEMTSLSGFAAALNVHPSATNTLLADTPGILAMGTYISSGVNTYIIEAGSTLRDIATFFGWSVESLETALGGGLYQLGASITLNSVSAVTVSGDSLSDVANTLGVSVTSLALANQTTSGLLTGTVYVGEISSVLAQSTTLLSLATWQGITVQGLALRIADQPILAAGKTMYAVDWVPAHTLGSDKLSLDSSSGTVNLTLHSAQQSKRPRLLLDLQYELAALEYAVTPAGSEKGYEHSDWLQFLHPVDDSGPQRATFNMEIGKVSIPVPLRSFPEMPLLHDQTTDTATAESAATLREAALWTYRSVIEVGDSAQDDVLLTFGINFASPSLVARDVASQDVFDTLAEMMTNFSAIRSDLTNLLVTDPGVDGTAAAVSAVTAMADYATDLAGKWAPVNTNSSAAGTAPSLVPSQIFPCSIQVRWRAVSSTESVLDSVVFTKNEADAWAPAGATLNFAVILVDGTEVPLMTTSSSDTEMIFNTPAGSAWTEYRGFAISYSGLQVIAVRNASLSAVITRNERLDPDKTTNERFVYTTPAVTYAEPAMVGIVNPNPIVITADQSTTQAMIASLFQGLGIAAGSTETQQSIAMSCSYELVPGLAISLPVCFSPTALFTNETATELATAVTAWLSSTSVPSDIALTAHVDLTVFSHTSNGAGQPLLRLSDVQFALTR